ncbi:hypothetical protein [Nocardiopsis synnemataformans]|uniref:hypothetical protein n=1 Tax=Nocardiopsis synnemataformans TaxID=61305 RepID=UPI003EBDA985
MARLDKDGVTVLVPFSVTLEDGTRGCGARRLSPGTEGYEEALAHARLRERLRSSSPSPPPPSEEALDEFIASLNREHE